MIQIGSKNRLIIDGFIIAAVIVVAINIYLLTELIGTPMAQKSDEFKMAGNKWKQYKQMQDQTVDDLIKRAEAIIAVAKMGRKAKPEKTQLTADTQTDENPKLPGVPNLAGILQVSGPGERSSFIALMEGKRLHKNDKINNYIIKDITTKGVLLSRNGETKFIPVPEVYFSLVGEQKPAGAESR